MNSINGKLSLSIACSSIIDLFHTRLRSFKVNVVSIQIKRVKAWGWTKNKPTKHTRTVDTK